MLSLYSFPVSSTNWQLDGFSRGCPHWHPPQIHTLNLREASPKGEFGGVQRLSYSEAGEKNRTGDAGEILRHVVRIIFHIIFYTYTYYRQAATFSQTWHKVSRIGHSALLYYKCHEHMHRHNLKSVSLTHIFGVKFANFDWKKKDEQKAKSSICMLQFQFRLFASTLHTSTTDSWNCGEPCCWCLQLEDKLRVRPQRMGKLLVENKAELNLQSLAAQWNADSNQTENCTQSVLHMSFFKYRAEYQKGETGQYFGPRLPCEKVQLRFRVVIWWPFCPLHFCAAAHNVFSSVPCWETSFGTLEIPS